MTRVLVVDDSRFMRTVIGNALGEAGYETETAVNGSEAVELAGTFDPDVVTMDVEMPELDGIDAVERIMTTNPVPILMLSAHTECGAEATLDALERGAVDFLHKPDGSDSRTMIDLTKEVVDKVDDLAEANVSTVALARATATAHATRSRLAGNPGQGTATGNAVAVGSVDVQVNADHGTAGPAARPRIETPSEADADAASLPTDRTAAPTIVLGASTGGPKIVERLFERLPVDLEAKVLVVQHMPPGFTDRFADRLDTHSAYDVFEASDGEWLEPGEVAVAPGDSHLEVGSAVDDCLRLRLSDGERVHGVRPSIDVTMESAATAVEDGLCGVVLTGMGFDGAAGIEAIKAADGYTIAQDEATSPVFGIPCQAIETGCVDTVAPADGIVDAIVDAFTTDGENDD
ncbi:chemotaxis-specific protein-glutamate methyltransferase CheB [Haloarchaeobius amylolyticus]|uniref:Protein-glutamate methylesterase/protein-glutamine glutaminase n=1 Tax=Haloarchaeobius amylolyticus TaxID=1198296 RepID=A0ABD6BKS9_9EURY